MVDDAGWGMSDFLTQYTSKSIPYSSPLNKSGSMDSNKSPQQFDGHPFDNNAFCTAKNLEDRLQYLNQELLVLGFPPIFVKTHSSKLQKDYNDNFDVTQLVNCTYELLKRQHHQVKIKGDLEERHLRSENDNEYLLQSQSRLKQDLENLKRESALLLWREKDQIEKNRVLQQDMKNEREEKRKMRSDVEHMKKQFHHETKRTEKEMTRLKEKVHQLLNDKTQDRKLGLDILNSLQRADGKRSTWKTVGKKNEEDMYKLVVSNYEEREKVILTENRTLREVLHQTQKLLQLVDSSFLSENAEEESSKQFQMPINLVKDDIEKRLQRMIENLEQKFTSKSESPPTTTNQNIDDLFNQTDEDLVNKLKECKYVIASQEKIIQSIKDDYRTEAFENVLQAFGSNEEEIKDIESHLNQLKDQEKRFSIERKHFTDYVLRMSKEKEEFEKERVEFYMHCISTPVINKERKKFMKNHSLDAATSLHTATPTFTPAPRTGNSKMKTPSTADLYNFMSLTYDSGITKSSERPSDGSYIQYDSSSDSSPSSHKLQEHVDNVRRAVEEKHNKSIEERKKSLDGERCG